MAGEDGGVCGLVWGRVGVMRGVVGDLLKGGGWKKEEGGRRGR